MEAMGGEEDEFPFHQRQEAFFQIQLGFDVEMGGGFVEDEHAAVAMKRDARQRDSLGLSAAYAARPFPDDGVEALRQRGDEVFESATRMA